MRRLLALDGTAEDSTPGDSTPGDSTPGDSTPGDSTPGDSTPGESTPLTPSSDTGPLTHSGGLVTTETRDAGNRRRIWRTTRYLSFVLACVAAFVTLYDISRVEAWSLDRTLELIVIWSSVPLSFGLLAAAGSKRIGDWQVVLLASVYLAGLCGQLGYFHAMHEIHEFGVVTPLGPYIILIGLFPLVVHTSWRGILSAFAASGISSLMGLAAGVWSASETLDPLVRSLILPLIFVVAIALGLQRGVMTLRQEAEEGRRLGSYRLEEQLGQGGMGEVWRATHPLLARSVAVKLVRGVHLAGEPVRRERTLRRFRREARTTASLQSSHTVRLFDYGVTEFPISRGSGAGYAEDIGGLGFRQTAEEAQLHQLRHAGLALRQHQEPLVDLENLIGRGGRQNIDIFKRHPTLRAWPFERRDPPCVVHEDPAHGTRRHREKVGPVFRVEPRDTS